MKKTTMKPMKSNRTIFRLDALKIGLLMFIFSLTGCIDSPEVSHEVKVWGSRGLGDGRFHKPRAVASDSEQRLYIVDMTGRVQVFDKDQQFLSLIHI